MLLGISKDSETPSRADVHPSVSRLQISSAFVKLKLAHLTMLSQHVTIASLFFDQGRGEEKRQ